MVEGWSKAILLNKILTQSRPNGLCCIKPTKIVFNHNVFALSQANQIKLWKSFLDFSMLDKKNNGSLRVGRPLKPRLQLLKLRFVLRQYFLQMYTFGNWIQTADDAQAGDKAKAGSKTRAGARARAGTRNRAQGVVLKVAIHEIVEESVYSFFPPSFLWHLLSLLIEGISW